ncbi:MAG TPA: amino acid adenylation domain-containing protein, partial [Dokdonella sp.]
VESLSGESVDAAQTSLSFLELGLDSLSLTQAALELERRYGLKLRFRRLLEDVDSIDKLADLLDRTLPAEAPPAAPVASAAPPAPAPAPAPAAPSALGAPGSPLLAQLIQSQLALMQQQTQLLAALAAAPAASTAAVVAPLAAAASAPSASSPAPLARAGDEPAANLVERPFGASARITLTPAHALTPAQRAFVDDFTRRYNARTAKSKAYSQAHRRLMADPRVVTGFNPLWKELVYPIVVERSKGAHLWDVDGNDYVDCLNAFGANFLGYQPDAIVDALKRQIDAGFEVGPQHPLAGEVAALIAEMTGMARVAFCNTGSEAVMGAMRIARTVTGRSTIAIFTNSYHGIFDEVIVRGTRRLRSIAAAPGILASAVENVLVLDYGSEESLRTIRERAHELAAVMIEPVQGRNPSLQPREFVRALRPICDEAGCALIFDEVITGFRVAQGGAQEFYGVRADIATYGKVIGGGLPFAAIAGDAKWMDALDGGDWRFGDDSHPEAGVTYFAGTFVRHPLALAAAKAALLHLKRRGPSLQRELNARTAALIDRLNAIFAARAAPLTAVGFSSLWRIVADDGQPYASVFWYALRMHGLHVYEQFNGFLTEAHADADLDRIAAAVDAAAAELVGAGLLTPRAGSAAAAAAANDAEADAHAFPLTDGQLEKWLGAQYGAGAALAYNEAVVLRLDGALDVAALRRALGLVWSRHEAFTLGFAADGRRQAPHPRPPLPLRELDFSGAGADARLDAFCDEEMHRPFDLSRPPLLRLALVDLGDRRHALHLIAHHLVMDGWSFAVFLGEVESAYNAYVAGREPALPPAQSFRAYALAERERRARDGEATLAYWRAQYPDLPPPLELPTDRPRADPPDFAATSLGHAFAGGLVQDLRREAARSGVTLYSLLLAAFGVLLARLSGQREFVVDIPFAGQALAGSGALIGDGVNTLPLRLRLDAARGFAEFAVQTNATLLDAAEHQDTTLMNLLRALVPRRRGTRGPLGDVVFNLNPRVRDPAFAGLAARWQDCRHAALLWDLFFNLNDSGHALTLDLHYRTGLYDEATVRRWIAQYESILAAVAGGRADDPPSPWQAHVEEAMSASSESDDSLVDLIGAQVRRTPDAVALRSGGRAITYAELWRDSERLARRLLAAGVAAGERVGVCVPRRTEMVTAVLGVLRAGAAYVPLDASFPDRRLRLMIERAALRRIVVLGRDDLPPAVADSDASLVPVARADAAASGDRELPAVRGDDLAYVLFTSGSTGEPKGVCILHRNLVNFLRSMRETPGFARKDTICAVTTLSFDIAGLELYLPLTVGGCIALADEQQVRDPRALLQLVRDSGTTVLQTTPTLLRLLCGDGRAAELDGLKLLVGGEALPRDLANAVLEHCGELWNMYGPTETTIWSTLWRVTPGDAPVPLGTPIANTRVYVLDDAGRPVADGERGEIWIGGDGVADGYLGRPELTAERFRPDPFVDGERMYRTGDIGSLRDGVLHFHGRSDDQVKLRGFRIELGDVEAAAHEDAEVREAAAAVREFGPGGDRRLVLYVTADGGGAELAARLRARLRETLPPYMRPHQIAVLPSMPLTPNGKIDRKALPTPPESDEAEHGVVAADADPREAYLASIWREQLGVGEIGADDNFFELGGDSLLAIDMMARIERETGLRLNVLAIASGTLGSLAAALPERGRAGAPARTGWLSRLRGVLGERRAG